jgi:AraC-like DNA-binding protein
VIVAFTAFSTTEIACDQQLDAWRAWFDGLYDVEALAKDAQGFEASSAQWVMDGAGFGRVSAPALRAERTRRLIHRNPVDHWVIGVGKHVPTRIRWRDTARIIAPQTPFVASLGDAMTSERDADHRMHLYLARDRFSSLAPALDATRGAAVEGPLGGLLRDYLAMLDRHLPGIAEPDLPRLGEAIGAMVAACVAPTPDRTLQAAEQIDLVRLERARQLIRRHLRSARLGPDLLCRELGTSRSQLYRLFQNEGGVARYIQQCRLMAVHAALTDPSDGRSIAAVAEDYGFYDASAFSRTFRREFGMSPREVRASGAPAWRPRPLAPAQRLKDCLRAF